MEGRTLGWWPSVAVVSAVSALLVVVLAPPTAVQASLRRVRADPVKTAARTLARSAGCPQMDNPGGRLRWTPSARPGPFPTDGTVTLPSLGVRAPIVRVGVDLTGAMVVPTNARDVAWLDEGPLPGVTNNIVLAGHIDYNGVIGSFGHIQSLRPGDTVELAMGGRVWVFKVQWTCLFDRNTPAAEQIMGYTERPSVTLISCGGVWDPAAGTHDKRVAVRGQLVRTIG